MSIRIQTYPGHYTPEYRESKKLDFIAKSKDKYPGKLSYEKLNYYNSQTKVIITCNKHGDFTCTPNVHLSKGMSCRECAIESHANFYKKSKEDFVGVVNSVHDWAYGYELLPDNFNSYQLLDIVCKEHGVFKQTSASHQSGKGCVECGYKISGSDGFYNNTYFKKFPYKASYEGRFYLINLKSEEENFYKVGITTTSVKRRFSILRDYSIQIVNEVIGRIEDLYELEQLVLSEIEDSCLSYKTLVKFEGHTECFKPNIALTS